MRGRQRNIHMLADPKIPLVAKRRQTLGDERLFESKRVLTIFPGVRSGRRRDCSRRPPTPPGIGFPTRRFMIGD